MPVFVDGNGNIIDLRERTRDEARYYFGIETVDRYPIDLHSLVYRIQELLIEEGIPPGPLDGEVGPRTLEAMKAFMKRVVEEKPLSGQERELEQLVTEFQRRSREF